MRTRHIAIVAAWVLGAAAPALAKATAQDVLAKIGVRKGICVVLGDRKCELALGLARASDLVLLVQLPDAGDVAEACRAADQAGMYGTRIYVAKGDPTHVGLADNVADAVVAPDADGVPQAEALRVLRPEGKAVLGDQGLTKRPPDGTDDWSHHYHGPDNNPQSKDRLARAPYLTQFVVAPRYAPAPQACVAAGGRVFMAFGNVAWHPREEPWLNTLVALNGYNGTLLWKRALKPGLMVDRCTMIATPTLLYLADDQSCKRIDAATGQVQDEIVAPADLTGGTFWKWMALSDGVLYALVGPDEPRDPDARWRRQGHGWPWDGISKGYNQGQYTWGFAKTFLAIDPKTRKVLWHHQEDDPIDSRSLCVSGGRVFFCRFGEYLVSLDARTGKPAWRRTAEKDADLFKAIGPYRPGHGYVGGWKSTVYLKAADKALYFVGPQVNWLTAVSADDGRLLWANPAKDLHVVIRDDALYTIGCEANYGHDQTKKLDLMTGRVLAAYPIWRRACTRSTGTADGILFRASGGSVRLDLASGKAQWISPMRPSCHVGVVIAQGHLYWVPWACDCNLQLYGAICLGPAGDFAFDAPADEAQRLQRAADKADAAAFSMAPDDWPTYRADNRRSASTRASVGQTVRMLWHHKPTAAAEATAPVAAGGLVFLGGRDGTVRALDGATGGVRWTAYTGGAVRYPPAIADGRALVGAGDGWAYAFEAATGKLLWRFRAAPAERGIRVFGELLSTWPVAAGVLVQDGAAYLAAGMNNFDGTHVYALDAATGRIKWQNNTSGHLDRQSRRGVGVQGDLLLADGRLYLAGGNAVSPGMYEAATGKCLNPPPTSMGSQAPRGRELRLAGNRVTVSGQPFYSHPDFPVYDNSVRWEPDEVLTKNAKLLCVRDKGKQGAPWELVARSRDNGAELWRQPLPGEPVRWGVAIDARGRVVVALGDGQVVCFGTEGT